MPDPGIPGLFPELEEPESAATYAQVALPVPLDAPLTYRIPPAWAAFTAPGCRVRVRLGKRELVGVVVEILDRLPPHLEAVGLRDLLETVDGQPLLSPALLELCRFLSEYYLAPIGDSILFICPAGLPPLANPLLRLTSLGALAAPKSEAEAELQQRLLEGGPIRWLGLLTRGVDVPAELLEDWQERGWLALEDSLKRTRYIRAYDLAPGELAELVDRAGRSKKGREVLELLSRLGHPATQAEIETTVGCGREVIRRLVELGLLREFTQVEKLGLGRHRLTPMAATELVLRDDQRDAVEQLVESLDQRGYRGFLLHGMTGSGKTEVYLRALDRVLDAGRSAIVLVPEIALVPALASALHRRYGDKLAILHSNLSQRERLQEWRRIYEGQARLVLGPRSALFAPCHELGLIVVDEEHDYAYKQSSSPRYHGRDMALLRGRFEGATVVLASATPSLESRLNVELDKLRLLRLTRRAGGSSMPEGIVVDLRAEPAALRAGEAYFSGRLLMEIRSAVEQGDQVVLLRNRRGYSPVVMCRACGHKFNCEDCGLTLTLHLKRRVLACHYCGHERPMPSLCPACGEAALEPVGAGTERVEERFRELFPEVEVETLDADATQKVGGASAILDRFGNGKTQVLIGTQMVAKGHHFPRVSLAAVLFADSYLAFPDFRAVERTYSLLAQLAGRSGRGERPGKVLIQTLQPEHYAVRAAIEHDDEGFAREELRFRQTFHYPPYSRLIQILAEDRRAPMAEEAIAALAERVVADPASREMWCLGPAPAPFERLAGKWRHQFLVRGPSTGRLRRLVQSAIASLSATHRGILKVDVDPYDLL